ncbi:hybrid sensor histidine kinase/response regulator [Methylocystis parvus]|uniref:Chemotaxis protein CheA n=1 Tax=Methylocystis parvus TaxID=134 RepID=A0A6B8MBW8_9HYPH|nr:hybrid sensor histidine kinase/response regulator [Methylocystis parvus]QGM98160.1 hybrid sensor histidine kinase/response regulator [Methylocystis parvus]WBK01518.1 hybrid sensor histidine kinase/response regulator [Methylocystis parvus OBBP]
MDDLLKEFLQEATEHIDATSVELLRFEKDQADPALIASLFRHIHTIKGSSGFLSLPRVARLTHATETLIGRLRDGAKATPGHVSLILAAVDRLSALLIDIACNEAEPEGDDSELLRELEIGAASLRSAPAASAAKQAETDEAAPAFNASHLTTLPEHIHAPGARIGETVRVSVGVLDRLMGIVSELVLTRNQLLEISSAAGDETVKASVQNLSSVTSDLQDAVMRARMQPVERLFATLPRLVRDLSIDLGKKIELVSFGAETELDRQVIELIRAPLTHIVRNAADHGLETVPERLAIGKPEIGLIRVSATYDAGQITIEVKDDGRGLDLSSIRTKALARGLVTEESLAHMSDSDIYQFIMLPGFSTASSVTKVSGRGVGMDVVRENIQSIGGAVSLNSKAGKGTTVTLRIPLTLAIAPALILSSCGSRFAVPQMAVVEVVGVGAGFDHEIQLIHDAPVLRLRGDALPLVDLVEALELRRSDGHAPRDGYAVILRVGGVRFGLLVETIADVQEVVIEPLVGPLARIGVFSGQTILGDGAVVLILDPATIMERAGLDKNAESTRPMPLEANAPEREKTRVVLMRAGAGALKALPLSLIMRIEEVGADKFSISGDGLLMLHEGRLMPIIPTAKDMRLERDSYPVLILAGAGQAMALIAEEIVDVAEEALVFQKKSADPSVIGTVNIGDHIVDILDVAYFIESVDPTVLTRGVNQRPRILLVDDKQFFRDMLAPVLLAAGYEVTTAASGREALALIERGLRVHLAVTDIDMPEMDGYALSRALLQAPGLENLPIVALAPQRTASAVEVATLCGARAVVGKFDRRALVETVDELLKEVSSAGDEIERRIMAEIAA